MLREQVSESWHVLGLILAWLSVNLGKPDHGQLVCLTHSTCAHVQAVHAVSGKEPCDHHSAASGGSKQQWPCKQARPKQHARDM